VSLGEERQLAENPRIEDLRRRLDREPGSRVFAQLAEELRKAGQLPEAVRVARQGLLNHPGYPSARMTLGRALLDSRELRGARAEFEAVLRSAPDNILASRYLAECLEGLGDLGSALLQYRATLRLAPGDRHVEAQIRALELRLSPGAAAPAPAPPPPPPRAALLPRDGAIPVLDVDGPMELVGNFEPAPVPWSNRPTLRPPTAAAPPAPAPLAPPAPEPSVAEEPPAPADGLPALPPSAPDAAPEAVFAPAPAEPAGVPSLNRGFPEEWDESPPSPPAPLPPPPPPAGEAPGLSSTTLAELYFNQGFTRQAIEVYRELLEREPDDERVRARIVELEAIERAVDGVPPAAAAPAPLASAADPRARRREAVTRTLARLEGFLAAVRRA
jgi:tetratricopeptide (TPR) repeat protein